MYFSGGINIAVMLVMFNLCTGMELFLLREESEEFGVFFMIGNMLIS